MKATLGISEVNTEAVALQLNKLLANEYVLYAKTRSSHWNVTGPNFSELHKLFEEQYHALDTLIDDLAERIRSIGHYAEARLVDVLKQTDLLEEGYSNKGSDLLEALINDHQTIIHQLRRLIVEFADEHRDLGSSDFVTGLLREHEKMNWMLTASRM